MAVFTREDTQTQLVKSKINTLNSYMRHRHLPHELKLLIRRHYSYAWKNSSAFDERIILEELPTNIRSRVVMALNRPVLDKILFLDHLSPQMKTALCLQLTSLQILSGDSVILEGEVGTDAYIVKNGKLSAFIRAASTVAKSLHIHRELAVMRFNDGDLFCEYALLQGRVAKHPFTVTTHETAEILALSQSSFRKLVVEFPVLDDEFRKLAVDRFQTLMAALSSRKQLKAIALNADRFSFQQKRSIKNLTTLNQKLSSHHLDSDKNGQFPWNRLSIKNKKPFPNKQRYSVRPHPVASSKKKKQKTSLSKRFARRAMGSFSSSSSFESDYNGLNDDDEEEEDDLMENPLVAETRRELDETARAMDPDPLENLSNQAKLQAQLWAKRSIMRQAMREPPENNNTTKKSLPSTKSEPELLAAKKLPPLVKKARNDDYDRIETLERAVYNLSDKFDNFIQRQDEALLNILQHSERRRKSSFSRDSDDDAGASFDDAAASSDWWQGDDNNQGGSPFLREDRSLLIRTTEEPAVDKD